MSLKHLIAAGLLAFVFGAFANGVQAGTVVYDFRALCDDCAGEGELFPWNFENVNDGIFQTVYGRLTLFDYTPGTYMHYNGNNGGIPTEFEFSYFGSTLVDPFTISSADGGIIRGGLTEDGAVIDFDFTFNNDLYMWGGNNTYVQVFDHGRWFLDLNGCCGVPFDFGDEAQFTPAPSPGALFLLGFGLLGFSVRRALV